MLLFSSLNAVSVITVWLLCTDYHSSQDLPIAASPPPPDGRICQTSDGAQGQRPPCGEEREQAGRGQFWSNQFSLDSRKLRHGRTPTPGHQRLMTLLLCVLTALRPLPPPAADTSRAERARRLPAVLEHSDHRPDSARPSTTTDPLPHGGFSPQAAPQPGEPAWHLLGLPEPPPAVLQLGWVWGAFPQPWRLRDQE